MATHDKITLAREYCLCRKIPYKFHGEQLVIGDKNGKDVIFSVYNFTYTELIAVIDRMVEYDDFGWYAGVKRWENR